MDWLLTNWVWLLLPALFFIGMHFFGHGGHGGYGRGNQPRPRPADGEAGKVPPDDRPATAGGGGHRH